MRHFSPKIALKIILILLSIALFIIILTTAETPPTKVEPDLMAYRHTPAPSATQSEECIQLNDTPKLYGHIKYTAPITWQSAEEQLGIVESAIKNIQKNCASNNYTVSAAATMQKELARVSGIKNELLQDINKFLRWEAEYYYATKVWYFLRERGYSEAVTAGILGNMMIETSGGTLALNPTVYNPSGRFYGLCQWSLYYYPKARNMSFEEQLHYLLDTLEYEFKTFGFCYDAGFTLNDFLTITDPSTAALAFAKVYERCGGGSYGLRQKAAVVAYKYFTS